MFQLMVSPLYEGASIAESSVVSSQAAGISFSLSPWWPPQGLRDQLTAHCSA